MIVDGKEIAEGILNELAGESVLHAVSPMLGIVTVAPDFATEKYLGIKKRVAEELGCTVQFFTLSDSATTAEVVSAVHEAMKVAHGVVVQLPLPAHIDREKVLDALSLSHDVDGVGTAFRMATAKGKAPYLAPVVGAIDAIARAHSVSFKGKKVVVVGNGLLVGAPAHIYAEQRGAEVTLVTKEKNELATVSKDADIIILGSGVTGLLKPEMLKEGVVIFDAGTSEDGGKLSGDADPACTDVASLITPVPGGIGPVTVAMLFKNLFFLALSAKSGK